jgi:2-keto-4-pentenoate hydratase/2-oxohepta-3-ene-1,7-dioic acid hydratase in catechol pathway
MKIICIGRNYAEHTKELNNAIPDNPVVFMKPATALLKGNADFYFPPFTQDLHYECEVVLRICKNGKFIQENFASTYYDAFTLGIDFTARDLQETQKKKGLPWEIAKAFDNSAVIGKMIPFTAEMKSQSIQFQLQKNGVEVQNGNTADMLFSFEKIIAYTSQFFSLQQGDLIFTGTPSGVGPVAISDKLVGVFEGDEIFSCAIN